ncbi:hypothetical protein V6N11_081835 [Hibiscus sabdariffa]|uniref:Uncharacterized protein n=1 Tax=Hibiscus sabdariffa TaxID=183260 RepID=A0ABR2Q7C0_9ROSI
MDDQPVDSDDECGGGGWSGNNWHAMCSAGDVTWTNGIFVWDQNPKDEGVKQTDQLIYQTTLMESGFPLPDPKDFASRICS